MSLKLLSLYLRLVKGRTETPKDTVFCAFDHFCNFFIPYSVLVMWSRFRNDIRLLMRRFLLQALASGPAQRKDDLLTQM